MNFKEDEVEGKFVELNDEKFYKISHYDQMSDFFMSIVSDSDHWMFISSNGSLSAGRKDRDNALFPYYTVDKIHDYKGITGSYSAFLIEKEGKSCLWEPFTDHSGLVYDIERNIYKSIYGNKLVFEEVNKDLGVAFNYTWCYSEKFGFVKKSKVKNLAGETIKLELIDGIKNILPSGLDYAFQNEYSNLLDGYKKSELLTDTGLGLFMLSSIPVDRAEPSESLICTSVWSDGLARKRILLSDRQVKDFRKGIVPKTEEDVRATRGAYLLSACIELKADASEEWMIVAEINQDSADILNLNHLLNSGEDLKSMLEKDINEGTSRLIQIIADADGIQLGSDELCTARHFSNTQFNVMRGGIFRNNYDVKPEDLKLFVEQSNKEVAEKFSEWLGKLPEKLNYPELLAMAQQTADADFIRICREYLPLTFSRRHGDPSRPWNLFSIETKNDDGSAKLNYQGNWRDIFQNWEALALSYPEFLEGMISKFLNASTADGYNPYRITREGIDWECPDPDDPWAYIGYWGDHQIIYLQKFLELSAQYHPDRLKQMLTSDQFVYANVPYRIKSYEEIVKNPQDTIEFDFKLNDEINERTKSLGADAKLIQKDGKCFKVNMAEKILASMLTKLSNFIPEAGIWLNTQRPEWNDANNALVGNGVSMVTLYYLRRFLKFWEGRIDELDENSILLSEEVVSLFEGLYQTFMTHASSMDKGFTNAERKQMTDELGTFGSQYRSSIYNKGFSGSRRAIDTGDLKAFISLCIMYMDQSIQKNRRDDGLYHAYNLVSFKEEEISIRYLYEMLEGQVAVLSSGYLKDDEALSVLDALKGSKLFREDQYSYLLYPDRELPRFTKKNNIPLQKVRESNLLSSLIADKSQNVIVEDELGNCHFNGAFRNADVLKEALNQLGNNYDHFSEAEKNKVLEVYEEMFDHQSFTGRSGTFYAFEGLGSIYWHMVSKLLLAVQECYNTALNNEAEASLLGRFKEHYYEIKAGIGLYKSPKLYGAFPTDAYSHTPSVAGVQQPGMTGQVKEDVISRMGELGIVVSDGKIHFNTSLMNESELLGGRETFRYYNIANQEKEMSLDVDQFAFTFCKIPVIYTMSDQNEILVSFVNGEQKKFNSNVLDKLTSRSVFERRGEIEKIELLVAI